MSNTTNESTISANAATKKLGVAYNTIITGLNDGRLVGRQETNGRWKVTTKSVEVAREMGFFDGRKGKKAAVLAKRLTKVSMPTENVFMNTPTINVTLAPAKLTLLNTVLVAKGEGDIVAYINKNLEALYAKVASELSNISI